MAEANKEAAELLREISCVDMDTLELKKDIQHRNCPFCDVDDGVIFENHQTRQALFYKFKKCNRCKLIYPYPRPNKAAIEGFFSSDNFSKASERRFNYRNSTTFETGVGDVPGFSWLGRIWHKLPLCYSYQEFRKYAKKNYRVLDVGAGYGIATKQLMNMGCVVEAVEPSPHRAEYLKKTLGIKVYEEILSKAPLNKGEYDMVIFSQVLMHLFSTKETIEKVKEVLKPGGIVVASLTNFNSIIQDTIRSPYPGRGLTAFSIASWFTPESATKIFELSGFKVLDIIFRPSGLLGYVFVNGYPGNKFTRIILRAIDQALKIVLMTTGTSDYFAIVAKKPETSEKDHNK